MSDETKDITADAPELTPEMELKLLKERADMLGIEYSNNIGIKKLKEKIDAKLAGDTSEDEETTDVVEKPKTRMEVRKEMLKETDKLVRAIITCMNPNKTAWEGDFFVVGNKIIGTRRKFVPFGIETHIPKIIFDNIRSRQCQVFIEKKVRQGNRVVKVKQGKLIKEYAVETLPPLTKEELADLKKAQQASGRLEGE